jgi:hypothetical protein
VKAFPGWKCEYVFQPGGGQTRAVYNNPEGKQFTLLKDIEAWLGGKMQSGEDISGVVLQGQADREAMMLTTMDEKLGARGSRDEWRLFLFCSFRFCFSMTHRQSGARRGSGANRFKSIASDSFS